MAKRTQEIWAVYHDWADDEASLVAAFTGTSAERRAERYAEEERHALATDQAGFGRAYSVWNYEGNEDAEWEVDVKVERLTVNPAIPSTYRNLVRRRARKAEQRRARRAEDLAQSPMDGAL